MFYIFENINFVCIVAFLGTTILVPMLTITVFTWENRTAPNANIFWIDMY